MAVQYASIVGHDGSLWACSKDYNVLPEEGKAIASLLTGEADVSTVASNGFFIAGQKYAVRLAYVSFSGADLGK